MYRIMTDIDYLKRIISVGMYVRN